MGSHFANNKQPNNSGDYQGARFKQQGDSQQNPRPYAVPTASAANQQTRPPQGYVPYQSARQQRGVHYTPATISYNDPNKKKRGPRVGIIAACIIVSLVAIVGVSGVLLVRDAKAVKDDAYAIVDSTGALKDALKGGDGTALQSIASDIDTRSNRMHETTSGILWNIASFIPVYGQDIRTVQELSAVLDSLSDEVISPVASVMNGVSISSLFSDGAVNVELVSNLVNVLVDSKEPVNEAADLIASLPDAHIDKLQNALDKAKPLFAKMNDAVNAAADVAPYLPQMLGANGQTRTYVIVAQNNSELRSTGGFPGSTGLLTITDGKIELGDFSGVSKLNGGELIPQLITTNPDWSVAGRDMCDLWEDRIGDVADGAVALDPVFLQHLLALTGGVTLSDGVTIDGNNAAYILLHDVYVNKDVDVQDAYFAEAASAAAKQILGNLGSAGITDLINVVKQDTKAGRFMVWMANEDEERAIQKLGMGGEISEDPTKPVVGVYVDDNTWAKMSWYLSINTEIGAATVNGDGSKTQQVTVRLKNNITVSEAETMPKYITGYNPEKTSTGCMINGVTFYAPAGGSISDIQVSTGQAYTETSVGSIQVWRYASQIALDPQNESVITFNVTTSPEATEDLVVRCTPTAQEVAGW